MGSRNQKIDVLSLDCPDGYMLLRLEAGQISKERNGKTVVSEVEKGKKLRKAELVEEH